MMGDRKPRDDLYYFQWEVSDAKALKKMLAAGRITLEQIGELFLAVMDYVDQTEVEVSPELLLIYTTYQTRIDSKREARVNLGVTRSQSGQNGGFAKAENAKKRGTAAFKPPTLKQFRDAVRHYANNEDISSDISDYEIDVFFDNLKGAGWTIGGAPIQTRKDWESAILAKFYDGDFGALPKHLYYSVFTAIFANYSEETGRESADSLTYDFMETFDGSSRKWIIGDKRFGVGDWESALAQFMKQT